jgi:hypothetical protein
MSPKLTPSYLAEHALMVAGCVKRAAEQEIFDARTSKGALSHLPKEPRAPAAISQDPLARDPVRVHLPRGADASWAAAAHLLKPVPGR